MPIISLRCPPLMDCFILLRWRKHNDEMFFYGIKIHAVQRSIVKPHNTYNIVVMLGHKCWTVLWDYSQKYFKT